MRRRAFIAGLGSAAVWPLVAGAQQRAVPVVGFLSPGSSATMAKVTAAFLEGMRDGGYIEGRNGDRISLGGDPAGTSPALPFLLPR